MTDPGGSECSHALALSLCKNENMCRQIASMEAPLIFKVLYTSKNTERCKFGSFIGESLSWDFWTMEMSAGLDLKLLATTRGIVMPGV